MNEKSDKGISSLNIMRRFEAVAPAFAMMAGIQLDVFEQLKDGPMDAEALAKALNVKSNKLSILLYALVIADLLNVENDVFSNTNEADRFLVRSNPDYMGESSGLYNWFWHSMLQSAETIRTGIPQARLDWSTLNEDQQIEAFHDSYPKAFECGRQLADKYDFTGFRRLLDAAGGSGGLAVGLCESCHGLEATIVDLPMAAPFSKQFISENNMSDRIKFIATDLIDNSPVGVYDVVIIKHFIQTLSSTQAKAVLMNVGNAIETGGTIHILGSVIDDTRLHPAPTVAFYNLLLLNLYDGGQSFTAGEHRDWLVKAGFTDIKIDYEVMGNDAIVTARKA